LNGKKSPRFGKVVSWGNSVSLLEWHHLKKGDIIQLLPFGVLRVDRTILELKFLKPHEKSYRNVPFPTTILGDSYVYPNAQVCVVDWKL
jgi:hypothetical protein